MIAYVLCNFSRRQQFFGMFIWDFETKFVFNSHNNFNMVQGIQTKIIYEVRVDWYLKNGHFKFCTYLNLIYLTILENFSNFSKFCIKWWITLSYLKRSFWDQFTIWNCQLPFIVDIGQILGLSFNWHIVVLWNHINMKNLERLFWYFSTP